MEKEYAKYLLEKVKKDYNLTSEDFSRTRSSPPKIIMSRGSVYSYALHKIIEQKNLIGYARPGEKILDLGCGNGRLFEVLKEKDVEYFGIDNSEKLIEIAKNKYPEANFKVADALNLSFPDNYFDKIYCLAVFHQIPSEEFRTRFLSEAKRVLKKEGLLILTVWYLWREKKVRKSILKETFLKIIGKSKLDFKDIFVPWKNSEGKTLTQRYYHCFTKKELVGIIKQAGFKIEEAGLLKHPEGHYNLYTLSQK